ncbi:MAG: hypothetical protein B5M54_07760 [Candidatus Aminicenantes bacterium 4484_214]|nr:MAG: hypothetical protein B5M54_07760 [Candidatus Aminicenantes bacterium 4484_214]
MSCFFFRHFFSFLFLGNGGLDFGEKEYTILKKISIFIPAPFFQKKLNSSRGIFPAATIKVAFLGKSLV